MPTWLATETLGLPRWVWLSLLAGGVGIGLYLRHHNGTESEPEPELEPQTIGGNPVPPAAPIEAAGGGISPYRPLPEKPEKPEPGTGLLGGIHLPEGETPELPESTPPPEQVVQEAHKPVEAQPIPTPTATLPGVGTISPTIAVAGPSSDSEKQKARNEIARLQSEIDGLQNHISQLTAVIQAHPNAKQRQQWENERNADRANIENKRNLVIWWQAKL